MGRWSESWRIFRRCLSDEEFRTQVKALAEKEGREAELVQSGALQLLGRLQGEGRLVDFLMEDLRGYDDAQVGAAARRIHGQCRKALLEVVSLKPVIAGEEGSEVELKEDFDPSAIHLEGNVGATGPFRGILRHPGWRATEVRAVCESPERDPSIIGPAELEVT